MFDLEWLLAPMSVSDFEATVWQRESALIASRDPDDVGRLFGYRDLETVLEFGQPRPPSVRLASSRAGEQVEVPYTRAGRLDLDRFRGYFAEGRTIILNSVEDFSPTVAKLVQNLQERMSYVVEANAYLTPPGSQGFKPHYDTHDVIVLHIAGEKRWKVYGAESACPLNELTDGDPFRADDRPQPEAFTLRPGQVLYIPRGWIHEAEANEGPALHLTLGIHASSGRDLVARALEALCRVHPELREPLPIGFLRDPMDVGVLSSRLGKMLALVQAEASAAAALDLMQNEFVRRGRSGGDGGLVAEVEAIAHLGPDTALTRRRHLPLRLTETDDGVALQFAQALIEGPPVYRPAMEFVARSTEAFTVRELPGLEPERQLAFATSMLRDGLVGLG